MSSDHGVHESRHPTLKQYVIIAIFLFAITIVEFVIILPEDFRGQGWTIAPLAILSAIKFAAVIFFYMHLKFDNRLLTWVFLGGLALGFAVVMALVGLFTAWTPSPRAFAEDHAKPCTLDHELGGCLEDPSKAVVAPTPGPAPAPDDPGTAPAAAPAVPAGGGLVDTGRQIFITGAGEGAATPCVTCHMVEGVPEAVGLLGPDLSHIGTEAATRQPGVSAEDYLAQSIRDPESFIAEGVDRATPGLMLAAITAGLTDEDVDALVAFLMAQQ
ncbi:MAG: cytochrome C oxidase subunit IV family protein [Chloroflexota bacterium]|nr:cytochrome C oxidase subunit IV family protein [Chloroflexota bacterium]